MAEREYIVIVNKGVDLAAFDAELAASTGEGPIPNRSVDVANPRPASRRMTHWMLTDEEANTLRSDPRVLEVEIPPEQRDDIEIGLFASQTFDFDKTTIPTNERANWGLLRTNYLTNEYDGTIAPSTTYEYAIDGTGVDIVIQDTGIQADHPEWQDANGTSRLVELDWYDGFSGGGSMPAGHYTDYHGHGTHCAGISAGKTYGFAKGSAIYALKVDGLQGPSDPNGGIPISDCFDVIKEWHAAKTNGRPTVVNMSWGYGGNRSSDPTSGVHQGTPWVAAGETATQLWQQYGIVPRLGDNRRIPVRVASVDTDIEELIDAGVHVCIASGNNYYKIDVDGGVDYDNTADFGFGQENLHRGSSPYSTRAFMVGNISSIAIDDGGTFKDRVWESSNRGPGVNIWAPGTYIMSAASNINVFGDASGDYDGTYWLANITGTSMAAPQVAGVVALHAQVVPSATPAQMFDRIINDSQAVLYNPGGATDYDEYETHLLGSPNRMLYSKYGKQPIVMNNVIANAAV